MGEVQLWKFVINRKYKLMSLTTLRNFFGLPVVQRPLDNVHKCSGPQPFQIWLSHPA